MSKAGPAHKRRDRCVHATDGESSQTCSTSNRCREDKHTASVLHIAVAGTCRRRHHSSNQEKLTTTRARTRRRKTLFDSSSRVRVILDTTSPRWYRGLVESRDPSIRLVVRFVTRAALPSNVQIELLVFRTLPARPVSLRLLQHDRRPQAHPQHHRRPPSCGWLA